MRGEAQQWRAAPAAVDRWMMLEGMVASQGARRHEEENEDGEEEHSEIGEVEDTEGDVHCCGGELDAKDSN